MPAQELVRQQTTDGRRLASEGSIQGNDRGNHALRTIGEDLHELFSAPQALLLRPKRVEDQILNALDFSQILVLLRKSLITAQCLEFIQQIRDEGEQHRLVPFEEAVPDRRSEMGLPAAERAFKNQPALGELAGIRSNVIEDGSEFGGVRIEVVKGETPERAEVAFL